MGLDHVSTACCLLSLFTAGRGGLVVRTFVDGGYTSLRSCTGSGSNGVVLMNWVAVVVSKRAFPRSS
jgi:hypothetical protein